MKLYGTIDLDINIQGKRYPGEFLVTQDSHHELILGRTWMCKHGVIIDNLANCLYVGLQHRQRVFALPQPQQTNCTLPTALKDVINQEFDDDQLDTFWELVERHAKIFFQGEKLRRSLAVKHEIHLKDNQPFRIPIRGYSNAHRAVIDKEVPEMLADDFIEPASSPYSSPPLIQTKKDGSKRFCVDYRKLNDLTIDAAQPLPVIHETLKEIGQAKVYSTIDLKSGYWQIPLHPNSRKYTAFSTPDGGQYQFKVMPFGLKNAPCTFQNLMREVLGTYWRKFAIAYLDDIIIYSNTVEEHLVQLSLVLEKLEFYGLTCNQKKCYFGKKKLDYLGHVVTTEGNQPQPEHVRAILEASPPKNRKELRKFLGICGWLREYVPRFAETAADLTDLLNTNKKYQWSLTSQTAFEKIKQLMNQPLTLDRPDPTLPFIIQTDASGRGMGAILMQEDAEKRKRVISYASAKFTPTESNYHCNEQECLAVIWAIKRYRPYLEDSHFTIRTDSTALTWLRQVKDSRSKLARWACLLDELSFSVEHCPGKNNELVYALSRHPDINGPTPGEPDLERMLPPTRDTPLANQEEPRPSINTNTVHTLFENICEAQQRDPVVTREVERWVELNNQQQRTNIQDKYVQEHRLDHRGFWKRHPEMATWSLRVPLAMVEPVLAEHHDSTLAGHPGMDETLRDIQTRYYWPGMRRDIRKYVGSCHLCICTKAVRTAHQDCLRPRKTKKPWETIALDLMGPYPRSDTGKKFILVVTDLFSRWVEAFPIASSKTPVLTNLLEREIFPRWGYPQQILSDNGKQFTSQKWIDACQKMGL